MPFHVPSHHPQLEKAPGRIRQHNEEVILVAAGEQFARHGFKGTSMQSIADQAGLPKANLHYYFKNKQSLYLAVLANTVELWDSTFNEVTADDDPAEALSAYISAKMRFSREHPEASRIFAMEVISGCPHLRQHFDQGYRSWFRGRVEVFEQWIAAGRMDPIDPEHLIFLIWSTTQHYADFGAQICRVLDQDHLADSDFEQATRALVELILKGCGLTPPTA